LRHYVVLKHGRQPAACSFHHAKRERLGHQQARNRLPRFRDGIDADRKKFVGGRAIIGRDEHDFPATAIAFLGKFDSEFGHTAKSENDCHMEAVDIEVRAVFEACVCMRRSAVAGHFADTKRAHHGCAIGCASADDFRVAGAAAKGFEGAALREDGAVMARKDFCRSLGVVLPRTFENLRRQDDGGGGIGVGFCRVAVLWAAKMGSLFFAKFQQVLAGLLQISPRARSAPAFINLNSSALSPDVVSSTERAASFQTGWA
jgi:hypothetical protein